MIKCITCIWFLRDENSVTFDGTCQLNPRVVKKAFKLCSEVEKRNKFNGILSNVKQRTKRRKRKQAL